MTKDEHKNRLTVIFVIWHRKSLSIGLEVSIVSSTKPEKRKRKNVATVLPLGRAGGFPQLVVTAEYVKMFCGWWHTITNSRHDFAVNPILFFIFFRLSLVSPFGRGFFSFVHGRQETLSAFIVHATIYFSHYWRMESLLLRLFYDFMFAVKLNNATECASIWSGKKLFLFLFFFSILTFAFENIYFYVPSIGKYKAFFFLFRSVKNASRI